MRALLLDASRKLLQKLVDTAIEEQVDALLIAGDLFDREQQDVHTAMVLQRELRRLQENNIPVFIIWGNHDAETKFFSAGVLDLPDNVHAFGGRGGKQYFADNRAVVHGVSFAKRKAPESLLGKYGKPDPRCFNIGMLHTSLGGAEGHDNYAPCSVNELIEKGFDYWALGHIHKRQIHHEAPAIVMPGNPLGRHINEAGERSVSLVTLVSGKKPDIRSINLAPVRFERLRLSIDNIDDKNTAYDAMVGALNQCRESMDAEVLIIRLELEGTSILASSYQRDRDVLLTMLQAQFENNNKLWIDSVNARSLQLPMQTDNSGVIENSLLAQLQSLIGDDLLDNFNVQESVAEELRQLGRALPPDLHELFGKTPELEREYIRETLLPDGARWMRLQLEANDSDHEDSGEADSL